MAGRRCRAAHSAPGLALRTTGREGPHSPHGRRSIRVLGSSGPAGHSRPEPTLSASPRLPLSKDGAHQSGKGAAALASPKQCQVKVARLLRAQG